MKNNPKKSKALIITIIVLILLLIFGYLIYKNRDAFGVKTSASIAKIFSPLISSTNSKNLNSINQNSQRTSAQAGEDIKGGDNVSVSGSDSNNNPIIVKSGSGDTVFGFASQDIVNGNIGEVIINSGASNTFWDSFSGFLGGILGGNNGGTTPCLPTELLDTTVTPNKCIPAGDCVPPMVVNETNKTCEEGKPTTCLPDELLDTTVTPNICIPKSACLPPRVINGNKCENPSGGTPDLIAGTVTPTSAIINKPTTLSSTITNIGGSSTVTSFSSFFTIDRILPTATHAEVVTITPALESKIGSIAEITYNFNTAGEYQIRACADKKSESDAGTVTESNENNNCGPWTTFTVINSLPTTGDGNTTPPPITPPTPPAVELNKCLAIEQNPLTFTPEEKARLAVLLRQFYLVSSTLKTTEDITMTYNELDQQKNFISQIQDLTKQCYCQVNDIPSTGQTGCTNLMAINNGSTLDPNSNPSTNYPKWAQHGNPWYTKTSGGSFPYTSDNTGYLDYSQLDGGMTPAGFKVISGYYYGKITADGQDYGKDCSLYNNFPGYGLSNQINNDPNIYTGHYCSHYKNSTNLLSKIPIVNMLVNHDCETWEAVGGGYPGDSLVSYSDRIRDVPLKSLQIVLDRAQPQKKILEAGCNWKDGVILDNTERLLKIW